MYIGKGSFTKKRQLERGKGGGGSEKLTKVDRGWGGEGVGVGGPYKVETNMML